MAPGHGENPVYIDGIKCWRRYRFGGHIALRDAFDSNSLREFYNAHEKEDGYFQIYNSPDPPANDTDQDRILVQKVDRDEFTVYAWGMLNAETGEILSRNVMAETKLGPFDEFLNRAKTHIGSDEHYERLLSDPRWLLSVFDSFESQAHKPKIMYLVPELDRPLSGRNGIVETGVLRGLRQHDVANRLFELGFRRADRCDVLREQSENTESSQMTLGGHAQDDDAESATNNTVTIRYELPYKDSSKTLLDTGTETAHTILQQIDPAVEGTDYTYLSSLPAVDIHAYRTRMKS